jgi:hypothetical protein
MSDHPRRDVLANIVITSDGATVEMGVEEGVEEAGCAEKGVEVSEAFEVGSYVRRRRARWGASEARACFLLRRVDPSCEGPSNTMSVGVL